MREGSRNVRAAKNPLGTTVRGGRPVVTLTLIGICVVSWVLQLATGGSWTERWAFWPAIGHAEPWRMLTTTFLHSDNVLHILLNMYALWLMGQFLEPLLGRARFLALYLICALAGSVGVLLLASPTDASWRTAAIGASGAVFGLFGAAVPVLRRAGMQGTQMIGLIVLNFVLGFVIANVAWQAHLGGLVMGLALGFVFAYAPRDRAMLVSWIGCGVAVVLLVVLIQARYASVSHVFYAGGAAPAAAGWVSYTAVVIHTFIHRWGRRVERDRWVTSSGSASRNR
ncbi:rhomboid family intramembrane serine protease [Luteimicrobium subarcticum]|uniref:rhomboid family intramembrane serine protease n=1 Tax=Luteimicrobium subarcticum TaxID=620910 RepID=UPI001FE3C945|nr:rhomboid family intramembrane serine protease [Luteimicrobium subarcticum]